MLQDFTKSRYAKCKSVKTIRKKKTACRIYLWDHVKNFPTSK